MSTSTQGTSVAANTYPSFNSAWALFVYVVVPFFPILLGVHSVSRTSHWRGSKFVSWVKNFVKFLYRFAPLVAVGNLFWLAVLSVNQGSYIYANLSWERSISYYTNVDLAQFSMTEAYYSAVTESSYNSVIYSATSTIPDRRHRHLQASQVGSVLTLAYYTINFDDLLSSNTTLLQQVCYVEQDLLSKDSDCFDRSSYASIIPQFFTSSCVLKQSLTTNVKSRFGLADNSRFVADNTPEDNPVSPVIFSYFKTNPCEGNSADSFYNLLNSYGNDTIVVTYTDSALNEEAFSTLTYNSLQYLIVSAGVAFVLLMFGARGIYIPILTFVCVLFACLNAAALLPLLGYGQFSVMNGAGALLVLTYGCVSVLLFGAAWRKQVKPGSHPSIPNIMKAYRIMGQTLLYITLVSQFCFYSLLASPVIVVQQFGVFCGFAFASFFLVFHYILIPNWILSSWFKLSKKRHRAWRRWRKKNLACCKAMDDLFLADGWAAAMVRGGDNEVEIEDDDHSDNNDSDQDNDENTPYIADATVILANDPTSHRGSAEGQAGGLVVSAAAVSMDGDGAGEGKENDEDDGDHAANELTQDTGFWRGKRPLKLLGLVALILVIGGLIVVYVFSAQVLQVNLNLPQLLPLTSNLGRQYTVFTQYKQDLFTDKIPSTIFASLAPSQAPSAGPTVRPSVSPSHSPSQTISPAMTHTPTTSPAATTSSSVDYSIMVCYGLTGVKTKKDETAGYSIDYNSFLYYSRQALGDDLLRLCSYVNSHSSDLSLSPIWENNRDCLGFQYSSYFNSLPTASQNNPAIVWQGIAGQSYVNGGLIGVGSNSTSAVANPLWVCANFTLRLENSQQLSDDPEGLKQVKKTWESVVNSYGGVNASDHGIAVSLFSPAWTYPLLNEYQLYAKGSDNGGTLTRVIAIPLAFIGFFLWVFTLSDFGLTIFGFLGIFVILSVSVCLKVFFVGVVVDLFDVMLFVSMLTLMCIFPVMLINEYMGARAIVDRQQLVNIDKTLSPELSLTNKHVRRAIVIPTLMMVGLGIPALFAPFQVYKKLGLLLIIVAIISFVFTAFFQPYLLAFGCRTRIFEKLCYVDENDDDDNAEQQPDGPQQANNNNNGGNSYNDNMRSEVEMASRDNRDNRSVASAETGTTSYSRGTRPASVISSQATLMQRGPRPAVPIAMQRAPSIATAASTAMVNQSQYEMQGTLGTGTASLFPSMQNMYGRHESGFLERQPSTFAMMPQQQSRPQSMPQQQQQMTHGMQSQYGNMMTPVQGNLNNVSMLMMQPQPQQMTRHTSSVYMGPPPGQQQQQQLSPQLQQPQALYNQQQQQQQLSPQLQQPQALYNQQQQQQQQQMMMMMQQQQAQAARTSMYTRQMSGIPGVYGGPPQQNNTNMNNNRSMHHLQPLGSSMYGGGPMMMNANNGMMPSPPSVYGGQQMMMQQPMQGQDQGQGQGHYSPQPPQQQQQGGGGGGGYVRQPSSAHFYQPM